MDGRGEPLRVEALRRDRRLLARGGAIANLWGSFAVNDTTSDPWTVIYKILGTRGGISYTWNDAQFDDRGGPAWGMPDYVDRIFHGPFVRSVLEFD